MANPSSRRLPSRGGHTGGRRAMPAPRTRIGRRAFDHGGDVERQRSGASALSALPLRGSSLVPDYAREAGCSAVAQVARCFMSIGLDMQEAPPRPAETLARGRQRVTSFQRARHAPSWTQEAPSPRLPTWLQRWAYAMFSHMSRLSGNTRLDDRGRLVLPADFRKRLDLKPGDEVTISEESGGSLRIVSRRTAARGLIGLAGSAGSSVLDDLAADRREQAAAEEADALRSGQDLSVSADGVQPR